MIPLRDVIPSRTTPFITVSVIAVNTLAFLYELSLGEQLNLFLIEFGLVPAEFSIVTLFSSMFLHGGFLHFGGNMLYLWIFGDNVEDRLGHGRFLVFYLLCGVAAAVAQTMMAPNSPVPMIGASGAIAGVMGAYLVLYPRSKIVTLLPIFFFIQLIEVPAIFFLGVWFLMQLFSGVGSLVETAGGGVAFFAHVGGFAVGALAGAVARYRARARQNYWGAV